MVFMINLRSFLSALMILYATSPVIAYIDPGTAGIVVSSVWPAIVRFFSVIGAFLVRVFFNPIKRGMKSLWQKIRRR